MRTRSRTLHRALVVLLLLAIGAPIHAQQKQIIGYYPSWQLTKRHTLVTPKALPYKKFTIINFAFLYPQPDGRLTSCDTLATEDAAILRGDTNRVKGGYIASTSLAARAHKHGTKVMISVGGWEGSNHFPSISADPVKRAVFTHACVDLIRDYDVDGIDIDWEFPGLKDHNGTPEDKQNFTILMKELRDSLSAHGKSTGKSYLLTAALPAGGENVDNIEVKKIGELLDFLNVMTYDMAGDWSPVSGHHSPLYGRASVPNDPSLDASFRLYHDTYGIAAEKINLGAPFYAHTFSKCTALYAKHSGSDLEHFSSQGLFYHQIVDHMKEFDRHWDDTAMVPYLTGKKYATVVSYDDERSIGLKAQYVMDHHIGGLIIWEITGDYMASGKTPLLDVIYKKFTARQTKNMK